MGRLFNGEHNLRVSGRKIILELEPGLDAGRAIPGVKRQSRQWPELAVMDQELARDR